MKKFFAFSILCTVMLMSSCHFYEVVRFNRIEDMLIGELLDYHIIERNMYDVYFPLADRQYYFLAVPREDGIVSRPNFLTLIDGEGELDYVRRWFRAEKTFAGSTLASVDGFRLYRGDIQIAGTPCGPFYCAVNWLEDRDHGSILVSVNSF